MAQITYLEAVRDAIHEEMLTNDRVMVMGQDVELFLFDADRKQQFDRNRIRNTPICEAGFIGAGIGAALTGMRPVIELGCATFLYSAMDQIVNQAAKIRYMFGGQARVPLVIRAPVLYSFAVAAHHSDRPWGLFAQAPGLKIVVPSTPCDAKGLMKSAIRDENPVLFFEDCSLRSQHGEVPEGDWCVPIGAAEIKRSGSDVTIVSIASSVLHSLTAAKALEHDNISAEVLDVRTVVPLDRGAILESVTRTGRLIVVDPAPRTSGVAAEVAAIAAEEALDFLRAPVVRLTSPDVPVPFCPALERLMYPTAEQIIDAARRLCAQPTSRGAEVTRRAISGFPHHPHHIARG